MVATPARNNRSALSKAVVVDAAVELAARDGIDRLSIRKLAGHLGVEAMSLYYHVPSKVSLITLMADRTLAEVGARKLQGTWGQEIVELLVQTFHAATRNPAVLPVLASEPLHPETLPAARGTGGPSLELLEQVLQQLQRGQLPADVQVHAFRGLVGLTMGFIAGQVDELLPSPTAAAQTHQPGPEPKRRRGAAADLPHPEPTVARRRGRVAVHPENVRRRPATTGHTAGDLEPATGPGDRHPQPQLPYNADAGM